MTGHVSEVLFFSDWYIIRSNNTRFLGAATTQNGGSGPPEDSAGETNHQLLSGCGDVLARFFLQEFPGPGFTQIEALADHCDDRLKVNDKKAWRLADW